MPTREEFAALALALPETTAGSHFGQPDFRVCGKIFCSLDRVAARAALKLRREVQSPLLDARPDTFEAATGAWGASGWTHVELARIALDELRELVEDAWRQIAPKRLSAQHAAASAGVVLSARAIATGPRPAAPSGKRPKKAAKRRAQRRRRVDG